MFGRKRKADADAKFSSIDESVDALLPALTIVARKFGMLLDQTQLIQDNQLKGDRISVRELLFCVERAGLKGRAIQMSGADLGNIDKALPAIVVLRSGNAMLLSETRGFPHNPHVVLTDPKDEFAPPIVLDIARFEEAWAGQVVLIKRNYRISDDDQPFSWWFISMRTYFSSF